MFYIEMWTTKWRLIGSFLQRNTLKGQRDKEESKVQFSAIDRAIDYFNEGSQRKERPSQAGRLTKPTHVDSKTHGPPSDRPAFLIGIGPD